MLDDGTIIWTMPNGRQFTVPPTNDLLLILDDDAHDDDEANDNKETNDAGNSDGGE